MRLRLEVRVERDRIAARVCRGRQTLWSGGCESPGTENLEGSMARLLEQDGFPDRCRTVRFVVGRPPVQLRTLRGLPPVRGAELRRLVQQQADRFFRRRGVGLLVDARWLDRRSGVALAAALDIALADAMERAAAAANVRVSGIGPDNAGTGVRLAFETSATKAARGSIVRRLVRTAALAAWVAVAYAAGYVIDLSIDNRVLAGELEALAPQLDLMESARREIADVVRVVGTLEQATERRGWVTRLLAGLAEALPAGAHLVTLAGGDQEALLGVRARDARSAIAGLATVTALAPRLEGNVTRQDVGGDTWEHAVVRVKLRGNHAGS